MLDLPLFYSLSLFFIVLLQPLLRLLIDIYIYMYTCSFIVHILPPFVDLYIIHYVLIAYSTSNIVSFEYIYIYINIGNRKKTTLSYIYVSRSTLTYRALYYGKIETQSSYIYIYINLFALCLLNLFIYLLIF